MQSVFLLLLLIVVAARCSARILFVSYCIIRVICLCTYTTILQINSIHFTSVTTTTDVKEWYTYSSPHIYFHGRHAVYGIVAIRVL